jgi:23S rRNA (uracil1939-C5)-methyltransferase
MHLSLEAQSRIHVEHVRNALPMGWRHIPIAPHPAARALAYRTRARVHVRMDRRGRAVVGMHEVRTHQPVEVDRCAVLDPEVERGRRSLTSLFEGAQGRGDVAVALGAKRLPVLDVRWRGDLPAACFGRLERAVCEKTLAGAQVALPDAKRPAVVGDPTPWTTGADDKPLRLAPAAFAQANDPVNAVLGMHVSGLVKKARAQSALELYSGAGNLSVLLADQVPELVCVEKDPAACEAARANLDARGLHARVVEMDALLYGWRATPDMVVLDPPRTGARDIAARLASSRVARIIYVSCDAQTLGRDLALLRDTYALQSIATFEMFPQTSHVEIVAELARAPR